MATKLTKAQRRWLAAIERAGGRVRRHESGVPFVTWNFVARLSDAGLVKVHGDNWPTLSADAYSITQAGREALAN